MNSSRSDKIVRVKLTDTETNTHQVYLTTKREAEQRLKYVAYGEKFEYYPYRWFEIYAPLEKVYFRLFIKNQVASAPINADTRNINWSKVSASWTVVSVIVAVLLWCFDHYCFQ